MTQRRGEARPSAGTGFGSDLVTDAGAPARASAPARAGGDTRDIAASSSIATRTHAPGADFAADPARRRQGRGPRTGGASTFRSAEGDRHEDPATVALDQQGDRPMVALHRIA